MVDRGLLDGLSDIFKTWNLKCSTSRPPGERAITQIVPRPHETIFWLWREVGASGGYMTPLMFSFNFQLSRMSGSPSRRPLSTISRLDPWRTGGSWRTFWRLGMAWRCHVSISRSLGHQEAHQEPPYPSSPGWILGGQVVPDAHSGVVGVDNKSGSPDQTLRRQELDNL